MTEQDTRALAARVAARAQITNIRASSVEANLLAERETGRQLSYNLEPEVVLQWAGPEEDSFVVQVVFSLTLAMGSPKGEGESESHEQLAKIKFALEGLFSLEMRDGDDAPSEDEMKAYAQTTGLFALYPFAREWAHDLTGRLGLPPLTLGVLFMPVDGPTPAIES